MSVHRSNSYDRSVFIQRPLLGPLLFDNTDSDARDHCANERSTFPPVNTNSFPHLLHLFSPPQYSLPVPLPTPTPSNPRLTSSQSLPLLAPPEHLHGHSQHSNRNLLPPKIPTNSTRTPFRPPLRHSLLVLGSRLLGFRHSELHQDCHEILEARGHCAIGLENADCEFFAVDLVFFFFFFFFGCFWFGGDGEEMNGRLTDFGNRFSRSWLRLLSRLAFCFSLRALRRADEPDSCLDQRLFSLSSSCLIVEIVEQSSRKGILDL